MTLSDGSRAGTYTEDKHPRGPGGKFAQTADQGPADPQTAADVAQFQKDTGTGVTGKFDPATNAAITAAQSGPKNLAAGKKTAAAAKKAAALVARQQKKAAAAARAHAQAVAATVNKLPVAMRATYRANTPQPPDGYQWTGNHQLAPVPTPATSTAKAEVMSVLQAAQVRYDTSPLGTGNNWVTKVGGLPLFIRAIAHALIRAGHSESSAIANAVGTVKRWASGGGNVTPKTRAKAAAALAEWESKKAAAHAERGVYDEAKHPRGDHGKWAKLAAAFESLQQGGFSIHAETLDPPTTGFMVARADRTVRYPTSVTNDPQAFLDAFYDFVQHRSDDLDSQPDMYVGGWIEDGKLWLDPAENVADRADAVRLGQTRDQISVYDVVHRSTIDTGGSGGRVEDRPHPGRQRAPGVRQSAQAADGDDERRDGADRRGDPAGTTQSESGTREALTEASTAGSLLPVGQAAGPHRFRRGGPNGTCRLCRKAASFPLHTAAARATNLRAIARARRTGIAAQSEQIDRHADTIEVQTAKAMLRLFGAQRKAALSRLQGSRGRKTIRSVQPEDTGPPATGVDAAAVFDTTFWAAQTEQALAAVYDTTAALTTARLGDLLHPGITVPVAVQSVEQALAQRARTVGAQITQTTYDAIAKTLTEGLTAGEPMGKLVGRVEHVFDTADSSRAEMIARTESISSLNQAAQSYAQALPKSVVAYKKWVATPDERTRPTHRAANGQEQDIALPFTVGGTLMMFPGDPAAPPSETINCRCRPVYIPRRLSVVPAA